MSYTLGNETFCKRIIVAPLRDDKHMTSMKIVQFSRSPTPFVHLRPKFFHSLDLGRTISNEPPPPPPPSPTPNDNQSIKRKHNPRMTIICYHVHPLGWLSFSVSAH